MSKKIKTKKAPYWLSTLSAFCAMTFTGMFGFLLIVKQQNIALNSLKDFGLGMLGIILTLIASLFLFIVTENIKIMKKKGIRAIPK